MQTAQYDVPVAYLNATPSRGTVCKPIPGYEVKDDQGRPMYVHIKKNLYGSVEAAKRWADVCNAFFIKEGFTQLRHEPTILVNRAKGLAVCIYVDDFALGYTNETAKKELEERMRQEFDIKIEGDIDNYLGMRYTKTEHGYFIDQEERVVRLVQKLGISKNTTHKSPYINVNNFDMTKMTRAADEIEALERRFGYDLPSVVGELLYIAKATRPDILVAVSIVAGHIALTSEEVFRAANRILEYLWNTRKQGLHQLATLGKPKLKIYVDASYMSERNCHGHSRYGYVAYLDNSPIEW
jgi:hypothetical protein